MSECCFESAAKRVPQILTCWIPGFRAEPSERRAKLFPDRSPPPMASLKACSNVVRQSCRASTKRFSSSKATIDEQNALSWQDYLVIRGRKRKWEMVSPVTKCSPCRYFGRCRSYRQQQYRVSSFALELALGTSAGKTLTLPSQYLCVRRVPPTFPGTEFLSFTGFRSNVCLWCWHTSLWRWAIPFFPTFSTFLD